ncbi:MAG: futalosine hydrolase [Planctomycetia bacterium]
MPRTLILVPTEMERRSLEPILLPMPGAAVPDGGRLARVALCGFGPVAAAARTAQLLAEHAPARVLLVGIAGRIDERLAVGHAYRFDQVACYGVGAGSGADFVPAAALGWQQWAGDTAAPEQVGDLIECGRGGGAGRLRTACAAAGNAADVLLRRQAFPAAVAEDMEGFGVATACRLWGVPLDIVRGISNTAGDRDASRWQVAAALEAAGRLAGQIVEEAS